MKKLGILWLVCSLWCSLMPLQASCNHEWIEQIDDQYLIYEEDCLNPALYIESCKHCGERGTQYFEVGEALGHLFSEPTYTWSVDHTTCSASRICSRDASHIQSEVSNVKIIQNNYGNFPKNDRSREYNYQLTYLALFNHPNFETQIKTELGPTYYAHNIHQVDYKSALLTWKLGFEDGRAAQYFDIYRASTLENGEKYLTFLTRTTNHEYLLQGLKTGVEYEYLIVPCLKTNNGNELAYFNPSYDIIQLRLEGAPKLTLKKATSLTFTLNWSKVDGATRYVVYRKSESETSWKKIITLSGSTTSYTTNKLAADKYSFQVKAARYDSSERVYSQGSNVCEGKIDFPTPVIQVKKASSTSVKISWNKVKELQYYEVFKGTNSNTSFKKIKTLKELSFESKSLKSGNTYYYKVRGYRLQSGDKRYSPYSSVVSYRMK